MALQGHTQAVVKASSEEKCKSHREAPGTLLSNQADSVLLCIAIVERFKMCVTEHDQHLCMKPHRVTTA